MQSTEEGLGAVSLSLLTRELRIHLPKYTWEFLQKSQEKNFKIAGKIACTRSLFPIIIPWSGVTETVR